MVVFINTSPQSSPRRFLVKGTWSLSWRNSKKNLIPNDSRDDVKNSSRRERSRRERSLKHVRFDDGQIATEIPAGENDITCEEIPGCWYQENDYKKFEKDRVLTSLGYMARQRIGGITFDDNMHTIRGIENMCDAKLSRRQIGEKKDLAKAMKAEEQRQKANGTFPDLEAFRKASLKHSKSASERALALGQQDAWSYRSKPKNPMVEALTRGILRRKNNAANCSSNATENVTAFGSDGRTQRRRSIG